MFNLSGQRLPLTPCQILERKGPPTFPIVVEIRERAFYVGACAASQPPCSAFCWLLCWPQQASWQAQPQLGVD